MDQLKIALEHKFWILAGLAILLPPIGWWAATDNLAKETSDRNSHIAATEKRIPDPAKSQFPNEKWIDGAVAIDRELTASVIQSQQHLFDHQKSVMMFPPVVQNALDKCKLKYRAKAAPTRDFLNAKEFFVGQYLEDWKSAVDVVKPFKFETGEGLVLVPDDQTSDSSAITKHYEVEQWHQSLGFTDDQMWDVQEDIWFLRSLMEAIARVNRGTTEIGNARIKKINKAILRGGDVTDLANRRAGKASATSAASGASSKSGAMSGGFNIGRNRTGGGGGGEVSYKAPKAFDPDDEFGDDGSGQSAAATGGRAKKDVPLVEAKRWVAESSKWHKRGFVLELVMDEREIPTLLTSLSESPFPVEIVHVEHKVHTSGAGTSDFSRSATMASGNATANPDSPQLTKEQQQQQRRIIEGLGIAFNMHYLADVTVAGTLTIYNEPVTTAKKGTGKQTALNQPAAPSKAAAGGENSSVKSPASGKTGTVNSGSASRRPATSGPAKSGTASSTPVSSPAGGPRPSAQPTSGGATGPSHVSGPKSIPLGNSPAGK